MKKTEIVVKNICDLALEDRVNLIDTIVSTYFQKNEYGEIEYTPHLREFGQVVAITKYLISGVKFTKKENIYNSVINDEELKCVIDEVISSKDFESIMTDVKDIVEYKKQENIAKIQNDATSVLSYKLMELINKEDENTVKESNALDNLNSWIDEQRELNSLITPEMQRDFAEKFDPNALTDAIIKKYSESDLHKKNKEVIEANSELRKKDNKIISMQNELKKKNKKTMLKMW